MCVTAVAHSGKEDSLGSSCRIRDCGIIWEDSGIVWEYCGIVLENCEIV